ncbi:MAG: tryptophan synthase subunit beta [Firmicutes bacterium]|nr:tryptophan synthase subunit beta [Bacillota bacterium]
MQTREFGQYGGQFVEGEVLLAIKEVEFAFEKYRYDKEFNQEFNDLLKNYANRPSLLYFAKRMTEDLNGAKIYLKREDLNHTGAHKINNVLGQALLAKRMGKKRIIAETGAGQHGVATATVAALMGLDCEIYMGEEDTIRQALNVYRMELLGAKVHTVSTGTKTLKDAVDAAFMDFATHLESTYYLIGSAVGPHPYPLMVREFQKVIGKEIKEQILSLENRLPDYVIACVGGGSNAIGAFYEFIQDAEVNLVGCEAAGKGLDTKLHAATMTLGKDGVFHGMYTKFIQDEKGEVLPVYSISPGLDYPGVGPEHAHLLKSRRAKYVAISDKEAIDAFVYLSKTEGIIPAIESSHAVAYAMNLAKELSKDKMIVINLSGRGDKDTEEIAKILGYLQ